MDARADPMGSRHRPCRCGVQRLSARGRGCAPSTRSPPSWSGLRGAAQHNCRLCKSLREGTALDAGGSETLYDDIERYETSSLLTQRAKAALRYADALIWTPAHLVADAAAEVRARFSETEAVELTFELCGMPATRSPCRWVPTLRGWSTAPSVTYLMRMVRRCIADGGRCQL